MMKKKIIILLGIAYSTYSALGQECPCNEALRHGTQNEFSSKTKSELNETLELLFNQTFEYWNDFYKKGDKNIESGGQYYAISGFFNGSTSDEERRNIYTSLTTYYKQHHTFSQSNFQEIAKKVASKTVYDDWLKCVQSECSEAIFADANVSGDYISVTLTWKSHNDHERAKVSSVEPLHAKYLSGNLKQNSIIVKQSSLTSVFKKDNKNEDVVITINIDGYDSRTVTISKVVEKTSNPLQLNKTVTVSEHNVTSSSPFTINNDKNEDVWAELKVNFDVGAKDANGGVVNLLSVYVLDGEKKTKLWSDGRFNVKGGTLHKNFKSGYIWFKKLQSLTFVAEVEEGVNIGGENIEISFTY